ncbi:hypothetical protein BDF19DRAFT_93698 [Syncephalis fuscata]|nr:hypothetical protein BDF19DRAFT_93698 [Syncephalis fuscata]
MKTLGTSVLPTCNPYFNVYDCRGSSRAFYSVLFSVITTSLVLIYGGWIYVYRRRHGICSQIFRRADNYWLPVPMESFLVLSCINSVFKLVLHGMVLFGWPNHWLVRTMFNSITWTLSFATVALLTAGIIGHIPPIFSRRRHYNFDAITPPLSPVPTNRSDAVSSHIMDLKISLFLHVPSIPVLFWVTVVFCVQLFIFNTASGIWFGLVYKRGIISHDSVADHCFAFSLVGSMFFLTVVAGYYYTGFYRIIQAYAHRKQASSKTKKEELTAVYRFRRIFLALLSFVCATLIIFTIHGIFNKDIIDMSESAASWMLLSIFLIQYGVLYPIVQTVVYFTIYQNSHGIVQRRAGINRFLEGTYWSGRSTRRFSQSLPNYNGNCLAISQQAKNNVDSYGNGNKYPIQEYFRSTLPDCRGNLYAIEETRVISGHYEQGIDPKNSAVLNISVLPLNIAHLSGEDYTPEPLVRSIPLSPRTLHRTSLSSYSELPLTNTCTEIPSYQPIVELIDLKLPEDHGY